MKDRDFGKPLKANEFVEGGKRCLGEYKTSVSKDSGAKLLEHEVGMKFIVAMRLYLLYYGEQSVERMLNAPRDLKKYHKLIKEGNSALAAKMESNAEWVAGQSNQCRFEVELLRARVAYQQGDNLSCYRILTRLNDEITQIEDKDSREESLSNLLMTRINLVAGKALNKDRDHALARVHYGLAYHHGEIGEEKKLENHYSQGRIQSVFARSFFDWKNKDEVRHYLEKAMKSYDDYFDNIGGVGRKQLFYSEVYELIVRNEMSNARSSWREIFCAYQKGEKGKDSSKFVWQEKCEEQLGIAVDITSRVLVGRKSHRRKAHQCHLSGRVKLIAARTHFYGNGRKFTPEMIENLEGAKKDFLEEIILRRQFFGHRPHPSQAKAHNFLCKVYLLQAEDKALKWELAYQKKDEDQASLLGKESLKLLNMAEASLRMGRKCNAKKTGTWESGSISEDEEDLYNPNHVNEKLRGVISDYQALRTEGRKLECQYFRYCFAEMTKDSRSKLFNKITTTYNRCETILLESLRWFSYEESQEDLSDRFIAIQKRMLNICHFHKENYPEKSEAILYQVHRVYMHNTRPQRDHAYPGKIAPHKEIGIKGKMSTIQTANYWRLLQKNNQVKKGAKKQRSLWYEYAQSTLEHHREHIGKISQKEKEWKARISQPRDRLLKHQIRAYRRFQRANKGKPRNFKLEGKWEEYQKSREGKHLERKEYHDTHLKNGSEAVIEHFEKTSSRGAVCYFIDEQHLFLYGLFNQGGNGAEVKFLRVTGPPEKKEMMKVVNAIDAFGELVEDIIQLAEIGTGASQAESNLKQLLRKPGLNIRGADVSPTLRKQWIAEKKQLDSAQADALNESLLRLGHKIHEVIFPENFIPADLEALYFIPNRDRLRHLPLAILPKQSLPPGENQIVNYADLSFVGSKYELSYMPSLAHLFQYRNEIVLPDSQEPAKKIKEIEEELGQLKKYDKILFLGISPTSKDPNDQIVFKGRKSVKSVLASLGGRSSRSLKINWFPQSNTPNTEKKKEILTESLKALIVYFFGHVGNIARKHAPRKIIIHNGRKVSSEGRPWSEAMTRNNDSIYNEEISDNDHRANYVFFINACDAAKGESRSGKLPFSLLAACLDSGVHAIIGTNTQVDADSADLFASHLFGYWIDDNDEGKASLGYSMKTTIQKMLRRATESGQGDDSCMCHPLNWGSYVLMGNLDLKLTDILMYMHQQLKNVEEE